MKTFDITLKHDSGKVTVRVGAGCLNDAITIVCKAENAPTSAVETWRVVPTARQIARTKSLMRGL